MPSESSATVGEYLQTRTGLRNLILALVAFIVPMVVMYPYGFGVPLLRIILALICAFAVFINLWRETAIWLLVSYLIWEFIVLFLWRALGGLDIVPIVFMLALIVVGYGFVLGEVVNRHLAKRVLIKGSDAEREQASRVWDIHMSFARFGMQLSHRLLLSDLDKVPRFALPSLREDRTTWPVVKSTPAPADSITTPPQRKIMFESELYGEPETLNTKYKEPEARNTRRSVTSAPIAGSGLYIYTFILEFVSAVARSIVIAFAATVVFSPLYLFMFATTTNIYSDPGEWLGNNAAVSLVISAVIGFGLGFWPLITSLFHVLLPVMRSGSGPTERDTLGAREPTRDEMETIIDTVQRIQAESGKTITKGAPSEWLVLDEPFPDAYTIGSTVYLTRAAIENDNLAGIMAHEMGHIAHKDGDLLLSLRRFIVPLAYWVGIDRQATAAGAVLGTGSTARLGSMQTEDEKIFFRFEALKIKLGLAFWFGGLGLLLLGRSWAQFWRQRDFLADDYAVKLGQADSLMSLLEIYRHIDVAQPYLLTNRPYTAERLDRLKG